MQAFLIRIPIVVAVASLGLVISSSQAGGAQPQTGDYSYTVTNGASGYPTVQVYFSVSGQPGHLKVKKFGFIAGYLCGEPVEVGAMQVKPSGKFKGKGVGSDLAGNSYTLKVKGKFKKATKAVGTVKAPCVGKPMKFKATKAGVEVCDPPGPACRGSRTDT